VRIEIKTIVLTFQKLARNKKLQAAQIYRKAISSFLLDSSLQNGKFLLKEKKILCDVDYLFDDEYGAWLK
jgi:hypothetical protein